MFVLFLFLLQIGNAYWEISDYQILSSQIYPPQLHYWSLMAVIESIKEVCESLCDEEIVLIKVMPGAKYSFKAPISVTIFYRTKHL